MKNAELITALRHCGTSGGLTERCWTCDYYDREPWCEAALANDAAAALEAAEHRIEDLEGALAACRMRKDGRIPKECEWITADNPPKNDGLYLVGLSVGWDNEYVVRLARYTKDLSEALFSSKLSGEGWYRWDGDNDCDVICHPKYWMELPKPPNCGAQMQTVTECHTLEEGER